MTFTIKQMEFVAENGHILHISCNIEKFSNVALWRVSYSYNGFDFFVLRDGLINKPNKRQIQNYLEQI